MIKFANNIAIGEKIREFRESMGITQAELAEKINLCASNGKPNISAISRLEKGQRRQIDDILAKIEETYALESDYFYQNSEDSSLHIAIEHSIHSTPFVYLMIKKGLQNASIFSFKDLNEKPKIYKAQEKVNFMDIRKEFESLKSNSSLDNSRIYTIDDYYSFLNEGKIDCLFTNESSQTRFKDIATLVTGSEAIIKPLFLLSDDLDEKIKSYKDFEGDSATYRMEEFKKLLLERKDAKLYVLYVKEHLSERYVHHYFKGSKTLLEKKEILPVGIDASNLEQIVYEIVKIYDKDQALQFLIDYNGSRSDKDEIVKSYILKTFHGQKDRILMFFHWQPQLSWIYDLIGEFNNVQIGAKIIEPAELFPSINTPIIDFNLFINESNLSEKKCKDISNFLGILEDVIKDIQELIADNNKNTWIPNSDLEQIAAYYPMNYEKFIGRISKLRFRMSYSPNWIRIMRTHCK